MRRVRGLKGYTMNPDDLKLLEVTRQAPPEVD